MNQNTRNTPTRRTPKQVHSLDAAFRCWQNLLAVAELQQQCEASEHLEGTTVARLGALQLRELDKLHDCLRVLVSEI